MSRFILPKERFPKPFNQNIVDNNGRLLDNVGSCVSCTFTRILETRNYANTGVYTELSIGYLYGRNNYPNKRNPGMNEEYTLNKMLERGTVPRSVCSDYGEIPDIVKTLECRSDILELDKEAEQYAIQYWENLSGKNKKELFDNVKRYLEEKGFPLAVTMPNYQGEKHCVIAVGYDDEKILWLNHDGKEDIHETKYTSFTKGYYLGELKNKEPKTMLKLIKETEFKTYIDGLKTTRKIQRIQLHHTYSPKYKDFTGNNHLDLQMSMKRYHVNNNGWSDIGQHFTIFPDGVICTGRDINKAPAGIYGANTGAICIECLGNFDVGGDVMTEVQKNAVIAATRILLDKFGLKSKDDVTYHAWWTSDGIELGTYTKGKSAKTCPGTGFFGGNTKEAYENNLMSLIENYGKKGKDMTLKPIESINDIIWELTNAKIITDSELWMKKCEEDTNVYWLCRKIANHLRGTLE